MNKVRLVAAASFAAAITLVSSGAAQAYPDAPNVTITIPDDTLVGGNTFSFTAKADVDCDWTITYAEAEGQSPTQTGSGESISGTYDTPAVSSTTQTSITATCKYDDGVPAPSALASVETSNDVTPAFYSTSPSTALQAAIQTASASAVVTLLPKGGAGDADEDGALPDTGGSNLWIFVVGGALVVAGGGTLYATRRRHAVR